MCPIVVIFAPTASGKTALAQHLFGASSLSVFKAMGEVISADSQAVYKYMNIGTAKPDDAEKKEIPHHLIDTVTPDVQFGIGEFYEMSNTAASEIYKKGKMPLLVGGSGFYIKHFITGLPKAPESSPEIREKIHQRLAEEGNKALYFELRKIDLEYAKKININDTVRICRALEVYYSSGKPLSSYKMPTECRSDFDFCTIILHREREELYSRIDSRVDLMFEKGLPEEIEYLKSLGYDGNSPGMKAIGYHEFFEGLESLEEIKQRIKFNSHRYAKKQYTFMKDIPGAVTVNADDTQKIEELVYNFTSKYF